MKKIIRENKKLYLIIKEKSGQNSEKIALRISEKTGAEIIEVEQTVIEQLTHIKNCKVVAIKNKGIAFSRDKILENVWDENYFGSDRVVDDTLRRLRKKLPNLNIHTIYGYGYRLG